ncbi:hypothetical protein BT93_B0550 [Corymbia citriodora subsp. variegata]|nr:hypothetical protein BT93_B0550 [Corymbia citriodora subsp. variegata]
MPSHHRLVCILSPSLSLLLFFFFFLSVIFHGVHSAFSNICDPVSSPSSCGDISIEYPFWTVSDAPVHCGYPGFGLDCPHGSESPILKLTGDAYFVTDINYDNGTLTLVDETFTLVDIDVDHQQCPRARHNLTIGSLPLDYNHADVNLTFFFNCSAPPRVPIPDVRAIDCLGSGYNRSYVSVIMSQEEAAGTRKAWGCEEVVVAAVKRTEVTAANVVDEFARAMSEGFVLGWAAAKECDACEHSGGRCAFNRTEHVQCYCKDGSIHADASPCEGKDERGSRLFIFCISFENDFYNLFSNRHDCVSQCLSLLGCVVVI